jgi:DNA-binding transcriptional ArsR family regulator
MVAYHRHVDAVFKALSDPTRRTLVEELAERDGQTLFELCVRLLSRHGLDVSRQAVAKHLDVLERAGLVVVRREGRYRLHSLDRAPLRATWDGWFRPLVTSEDQMTDRQQE